MKVETMIKSIIGAVIAIVVLTLLYSSFYVVNAGQRAIFFTFGDITEVQSDGLHFKIPLVNKYDIIDVRTQKATADAAAGTKDLQTVTTAVTLNYHIDQNKLKDTYTRVGVTGIEEKVIHPRIQEIVKAVTARYSAEQLITQRETVKHEIDVNLRKTLADYNVITEDILITQFHFSKEFNAAIEAKQTSVQQALKAKNDLDRINVEAQQRVAQAKGEAEAIAIQTQAIKQNGGDAYIKLKWIEKWEGTLPTTVVGSENAELLLGISK